MLSRSLLALTLLFSVSAFGAQKINGAGASFPAPIYYNWAYAYQKATGVRVNYQSIGSGGGIKQISSRTVDFGASDKPLEPEELKEKGLYQFPAVVGSIVMAINLEEIDHIKLSNDAVSKIAMGKVEYWDDPAIAKENSDLKLPHEMITFVHRSDGSGTTFNFTYWLSNISKQWKVLVGTGKAVDWPAGLGAKGNEGVANMIKQTKGAIGYIEYAYAARNKLTSATLQSKEGTWVEPTEANFQAAAANAAWSGDNHFYQVLALQPGANSYPVVAGTFILIPKDPELKATAAEVWKFFKYAFDEGDKYAIKLGYIPLPASTKKAIEAYIKANGII